MKDKAQQMLAKFYAPAVHRRLSRFPSKDQWPIASWLIKTPVGTNYALQIMESLEDLSRKEEAAPSHLLVQILKDISHEEHHPKQLGKQVRDCLGRRLHPHSVAHGELFAKFETGLGLPRGVRLLPPKNFEGKTFSLEVLFQDPQELSEKLQETLHSLGEGAWDKLEEF